MERSLYKNAMQQWESLKAERSTWIPQYQKISRRINPRTGRFLQTERNKADDQWSNILDNTTKSYFDILTAGLMSGATSPARPWFKYGIRDDDLANFHSVKKWLAVETLETLDTLRLSNAYQAFRSIYKEISLYGTAACYVAEDYLEVMRFIALTAGEYCIALDHRGIVDTIYRRADMTVGQIVSRFGLERCSKAVKGLYDQGNYHAWVAVIHAVEPRRDRDTSKIDKLNMPWRVCYFEEGADNENYLYEGGQNRFMAVCPRWEVDSGDIYGTGPGFVCVGDVGQLQHQQLKKSEAIERKVNPPMRLPHMLMNSENNVFPGGIVYSDSDIKAGALYQDNTDLSHLLADIEDIRRRIKTVTHADLFLMFTGEERSGVTATEIAERHEEKLTQLGPVMERLEKDMYGPIIDMAFEMRLAAGLVSDPPPELEGQGKLKVDYVSIMAQAQRAISANGTNRWLAAVGGIAQFKPEILDKVDADRIAEGEAEIYGVNPEYVVADEEVAALRQERAKQQQAMQQAALAESASKTANTLSQTPTQNQSALSDIMRQYSGYN